LLRTIHKLVYATHDQIWEAKETHKIDKTNLQNDVMQADCMILDVDCNIPALDPDLLPHCHNSTQIQRMPPIKDSEIGGSWGIRLLTSSPFSKLKNTRRQRPIRQFTSAIIQQYVLP